MLFFFFSVLVMQNWVHITGSGPCIFCGNLVCTREEQEVLNRNSRKSEQLLKKLLGSDAPSSSSSSSSKGQKKLGEKEAPSASSDLFRAESHKNRLLEYDETCEKRTKVRTGRKFPTSSRMKNKNYFG